MSAARPAVCVTLADIEDHIASEHFFTAAQGAAFAAVGKHDRPIPAELSRVSFCVLVLHNGFAMAGEAYCQPGAPFDAEAGRRAAREDAIRKLWPVVVHAAGAWA